MVVKLKFGWNKLYSSGFVMDVMYLIKMIIWVIVFKVGGLKLNVMRSMSKKYGN